ncbi:UDP-3-O-(3-hydroxymyristoyl)glucosamine N-acyltransferase [Acetonema longum]|uniref:UDP-3-O-acylglucosamine N-acyltransferase n=1 Tax=Acetonema longum DSM 6540 TaxID=1009370 RepID=F7NM18_9FIRM|nr:UDP-3-O-(3-hydroxymyristoyl)glucosamine N-acyltransferase [Acetonema longum]EGO62944.1 UDP-3-O-(3-hydroxymyristoyl) glucosamine N- acyltransferase [Acetonema longum DSM 6540]
MQIKLNDIAARVGGRLQGDGEIIISGATNIEEAGSSQITFAVPPHLEKAAESAAAAVIIPENIEHFPKACIRVANPREAFSILLGLFTPPPEVTPGIHPTAVIGKNVVIGQDAAIMAHVVIADNARIGDHTILYPHTFIGQDTVVGEDCLIHPSVTVRERCRLGDRVIINSGAVIGSDGFGFVTVQGIHKKVPQVGNVVLEDDVEIGANTAVDRATTGSTIVRRGTKVDNLVHIAHNDDIGENCLLVAQTGISGSVKVGKNVTFAGQSGTVGHITIGSNCVFAARSGVIGNVPDNVFYAGFPARPHKEWLRGEASAGKVPDLLKRVKELEQKLAKLEES